MAQINDFLGRFVQEREILFKYQIADGLYLALFRVESNDQNYTIQDYRGADIGEGGTGGQYCGFFNSQGICDFNNQKFSFGPDKSLFFFYPDNLPVRKKIISSQSEDLRQYLKEGDEYHRFQGIDDRLQVSKTDGVLKFVYPANDISYTYDEYGNPVPQHLTRNLHYLVGEVLLVGTCSFWGFLIPKGGATVYRNFFSNRAIHDHLSHLANFLSQSCSNVVGQPLFEFQLDTRTIDYAGIILGLLNERKGNNFTLLFRALIALFQIEGVTNDQAIELAQNLVDKTFPAQYYSGLDGEGRRKPYTCDAVPL